MQHLAVNWSRSIQVDAPIDDNLVKKLTPQILDLRQKSNEPITVGIDSPGGSLASLDVIIGLLAGPNQDNHKCRIITVATNRAYSAAANLLAFGDYSIALKHSQILFHDVRLGSIEDVTPEKAQATAKTLQDINEVYALRLADKVIARLVWGYIDFLPFEKVKDDHADTYKKYSSSISSFTPEIDCFESVDLASYATELWARLSRKNDDLIPQIMNRLSRWIEFKELTRRVPSFRQKGSRTPGMLDGPLHLSKLLGGDTDHFQAKEEELKLFLSLAVSDISSSKTDQANFLSTLEKCIGEYKLFQSMNNASHIDRAMRIMLDHPSAFFSSEFASLSDDVKRNELQKSFPYAALLWQFCVLLCVQLFEGEHILGPEDAQLLGLVDEVAGGGPIQSRYEFAKTRTNSDESEG